MWLRIYSILLRLYPAYHRDGFGSEMLDIVRLAEREIVGESPWTRLAFYSREFSGIAYGAVDAHMQSFVAGPKWGARVEVSVFAILFWATSVWVANASGIRVLFSPASWVALTLIGFGIAWAIGRRVRWVSLAIGACAGLAILFLSEYAWTAFVSLGGRGVTYGLPGMEVMISTGGEIGSLSMEGIRFSFLKIQSDGTVFRMINSHSGIVPPYRLFGGVAFVLIALLSQCKNQQVHEAHA